MKQISLSMGFVALVDDADCESLSRFKWTADKRKRVVYAYRWDRSLRPLKKIYMHQAVLGRKWVDHLNGDGLDNRRSNLRPCTVCQNNINRAKKPGCTSSQQGVYWNRQKRKWQAQILLGRAADGRLPKLISLGRFKREEDAIAARLAAETRREI